MSEKEPPRPAGRRAMRSLGRRTSLSCASEPAASLLRPQARPEIHLDASKAEIGGELIATAVRRPLIEGGRALVARSRDLDALVAMRRASTAHAVCRPILLGEAMPWTLAQDGGDKAASASSCGRES